MASVSGVVVVGDLLRPDPSGAPGGTDRQVRWLWNAVKRQVGLASGLPAEPLTAEALADWIIQQRPPAEADAWWASRFAAAPEAPVARCLRGRFCIGYELPPWLLRVLDAEGIPYVDIRLHPVRFLDDLLFAVRASDRGVAASLADMAVPESAVLATAGLREAMCRYISEARIPPNTLLVAGQRRFDSTQIAGGRFFDAHPHAAEIIGICGAYDAVVLKPHPLDRHHSLLEVAAGCARPVAVVDDNIYRLMALPEVAAVLTVNSGVAHEAPYFGKPVHALAPPPARIGWRGTTEPCHASVDDVVLTPDFWRIVLAPHTSVTPADGMRLPPKPNRLRIAMDSFWNYQQIDTDRIPRAA